MTSVTGQTEDGPGRWRNIFTGRLGVYTLILNLGMAVFAINHFVVSTIMPTVVADLEDVVSGHVLRVDGGGSIAQVGDEVLEFHVPLDAGG